MTMFRISILDLDDDEKVTSRKLIGEGDLDGLRLYLREMLEISDEKLHTIERELQDYKPLRVFDDEGTFRCFDGAFEIEAFDE